MGWVWWVALVENREKTWTPVVCSPSHSASKAEVGWGHHLLGDKVLDTPLCCTEVGTSSVDSGHPKASVLIQSWCPTGAWPGPLWNKDVTGAGQKGQWECLIEPAA